MNSVMSTSMPPDIYRHIARKSTVSRNSKSQAKNAAPYPLPHMCKEEPSVFEAIQCDIKEEKNVPPVEQSLVLLPDNEMEQATEETLRDMIEQIQLRVQDEWLHQADRPTASEAHGASEIHDTIDSLMNHLDENADVTANEVQTRDATSSLYEDASMESEPQSRLHRDDDDIVEIEVSRSDSHPPLCTCQCHLTTANASADFLQFEQALRQTRQEQQHERCLNHNRLIQMLKRQHQELMTFYQRQLYINKIDREQQTIQIKQHDTQIQTDISSMPPLTTKPTIPQTNGKHSTPNTKSAASIPIRPFTSFLTPIRTKGPSLQQLIPCLTTTTPSAFPSKTPVLKKPVAVSTAIPQPPVAPSVSQDVVDLTAEDEDEAKAGAMTLNRPQPTLAASTSVPTPILPTVRSNPTTPVSQTFQLRPLPEQIPPDPSIARPQLSIAQDNTTVRLTWNLLSTPMESIQNYEIYAYKQNASTTTSDWKKIGIVKSMRLPMAVTLKEFQPNSHYAFAVRAVSIANLFGPFCEPKIIFTGTTSVPSNNPGQLLNGSV